MARATSAAWLTFVGFAAVVAGVEPTVTASGRVGFALSAGLLALGPALLNVPPRGSRRAWARAIVIGLVGLLLNVWLVQGEAGSAAAQSSASGDLSPAQVLLFAVGIVVVYLISYGRRLRGQVLPAFVVLGVCGLAFSLTFDLLERLVGACVQGLPQAAEGTAANTVFVPAGGLGLVATAALGFWLLRTLAALIDRGWLNALSMAAAINLALLAVWLVVAQVPRWTWCRCPGWGSAPRLTRWRWAARPPGQRRARHCWCCGCSPPTASATAYWTPCRRAGAVWVRCTRSAAPTCWR